MNKRLVLGGLGVLLSIGLIGGGIKRLLLLAHLRHKIHR